MASLYSLGDSWQVQFAHNGRRPIIRLGPVSKEFAEDFHRGVERLLASARMRTRPDPMTAAWLANLGSEFREKLAHYGLVERVETKTVGELTDYCIKRADVRPSTLVKYSDAARNMKSFFGGDRLIHEITRGDGQDFYHWLKRSGHKNGGALATSTANGRFKQAKAFLTAAVDKEWLERNPFAGVKPDPEDIGGQSFFVAPEIFERVAREAPDDEFRLILALTRWLGCRVREVFSVRWDEINWHGDMASVTVVDSKRHRYASKRIRQPPLFPELRPYLTACYENAADGATYAISRRREITTTSLSNQLERCCRRAGIVLWQKPWHAMRATRETELTEVYPLHVVCKWLGNSPRVANRHYLQVTKDHYARAQAGIAGVETAGASSEAIHDQ